MKKVVLNQKYGHLKDFVNHIDEIFDVQGELVYKKRNTVKRFVATNGTTVIAKRYKRPNIIQQAGYTLYRPSKARRAYEFALKLEELGIDTPEPIAYIELWKHGIFTTGFFISTENNDHSCKDLYTENNSDLDLKEKEALEEGLMEFIVGCHEKGFMHGDTNLSNFLYHKDGQGLHFAVIDINRSKFVITPPCQEQCLDNLMRLTHEKDLLTRLVGKYASIRGWDVKTCQDYVLTKLEKFERKKKLLKSRPKKV